MEFVEKIRVVWQLRGMTISSLVAESGLSRNFLWDLKRRPFDLSHSSQMALSRALRIPLKYLIDDELWDAKTPEFIVASAALEEFCNKDDLQEGDRADLRKALDAGGVYFLEPDQWRKFYRGLKVLQRQRLTVTDFPQSPEAIQGRNKFRPSKRSRTRN